MTTTVKSKKLDAIARAVSKMTYAEMQEISTALGAAPEKLAEWANKHVASMPAKAPVAKKKAA